MWCHCAWWLEMLQVGIYLESSSNTWTRIRFDVMSDSILILIHIWLIIHLALNVCFYPKPCVTMEHICRLFTLRGCWTLKRSRGTFYSNWSESGLEEGLNKKLLSSIINSIIKPLLAFSGLILAHIKYVRNHVLLYIF